MPPPQRVYSSEHPVWNLIISGGRSIRSTWLFSRCEYFVRWGVCETGVIRQWDYSIRVVDRKRREIVRRKGFKEGVGRRRSTSACSSTTSTITTTRCCPNTFVAFVLLVFLSCVVPLSTPSSPTTTTTSSSSYSTQQYNNIPTCPTAHEWINKKGSFCFTLRESRFLKNITELMAREQRAILMFCQMDYILEKIDCAQPYSVNRKQCSMCRVTTFFYHTHFTLTTYTFIFTNFTRSEYTSNTLNDHLF
ncbi:unnamed protein product [Orchesella dallaii]|uniref:Uncharacterized protein n=1 Tax=Orchesella dallaii TaxID=48710 RepID=A0ABP1QWQ7_9HEXA